ncbi:MAG: hypothetical protein GY707_05705 [Desulfobacteraceae bacterium]|nr:hypothetical protein [Desulfobacteraceae bacterium]
MNEHEKEQALKLSALYKELAEKEVNFQYNDSRVGWVKVSSGPYLSSDLSRWRITEPKPEEKIIDLSCVVGNDIDVEFLNTKVGIWNLESGLSKIDLSLDEPYLSPDGYLSYEQCRIRQDHIHFYNKKENPLPDGLLVKLYLSNETTQTHKSQDIRWDSGRPYIMGFEVLEVLPEYKYGWETE